MVRVRGLAVGFNSQRELFCPKTLITVIPPDEMPLGERKSPRETLYICAVLCDVYTLYESGERLPEDEMRAHPVRGWLCYGDVGRSYPHEEAHLYRSRTDTAEAIPFVDYARVKQIKRGGLLIEGLQEHGYRNYWKQVWWFR
jgi:hypothetical protein